MWRQIACTVTLCSLFGVKGKIDVFGAVQKLPQKIKFQRLSSRSKLYHFYSKFWNNKVIES